MPDSLQSPLVAAVPVEAAGMQGAKNRGPAARSDDSDAFSRVLDQQQDRDLVSDKADKADKADKKTASDRAKRSDQSGKALPDERTTAAATPDNSDPMSAGSTIVVAAQFTLAADNPADSNAAAAVAKGTTPGEFTTVSPELRALRGNSAVDAGIAGLQGAGVSSGPDRLRPEGLPANASSLTGPAVPPGTTPVAPAVENVAPEVLDDMPLPRDAVAAARSTATDQRGAQAQSESLTLARSQADWLRSGIGSEVAGQIAARDAIGDEAAELLRAGSPAIRSESASAPAPTIATAGLTLASTGATLATPTAAQPGSTVPEYALTRAPDDAEFPGELTARMQTLLRDGVREARLQLHPAELGRLQVTVTTEGDQARVMFVAETSAARDAIEQSMPRLREMLEQNGLQLAQSDVGQRDHQSESGRPEDGDDSAPGQSTLAGDSLDAPLVEQRVSLHGRSRVDTYI